MPLRVTGDVIAVNLGNAPHVLALLLQIVLGQGAAPFRATGILVWVNLTVAPANSSASSAQAPRPCSSLPAERLPPLMRCMFCALALAQFDR